MRGARAALRNALARTPVQSDVIALLGGMDTITSPYQRKPGRLRQSQNFEALTLGGYRRIRGYERYDGQAKPSDADYGIIECTISGTIAVGDTLTGLTSSATGEVIAISSGTSPQYVVMTKISGTFQSGEALQVGGTTRATSSSEVTLNGASTSLLRATYKNAAADVYRADIAAVPGAGPIRGVIEFDDIVYAWRNNVGNTAMAIYKSSGAGWVNVPLGEEISFTAGSGDIDEGDTLTKGGVTATIKRVVITSGSLGAGTAAGRLVIYGRSGGNYSAGAATTTGVGALTLSGAQTAITLLPNGRCKFDVENFTADPDTRRIYGADSVNRGFEFDGTDYGYVPITTGMDADAPHDVVVHEMQLFFAFGASLQHSAPGTPYIWSPIVGAAELGMGDHITGFSVQPGTSGGGALAVFTRNRLKILYGTGVADWDLKTYRREVGAYEHTVQDVGYPMFLDDRGITNLQTSQNFGNFAHNAVSESIRNIVNDLRPTAVASCISRDSSQYRVFFTSGYALYVTAVGQKVVGIMQMLFPDVVRCIWSGERSDGSEAIYFGSDDGMVYQMERGTSFDGDDIEFYFDLAYNFQGSPRVEKTYRDAALEIDGSAYAAFSFGYSLGYGSSDVPQPDTMIVTPDITSVQWDVSMVWDAFQWDGQSLTPSVLTVDGDAENISLGVSGSSDIVESFTITSVLIGYTPRGRLRP